MKTTMKKPATLTISKRGLAAASLQVKAIPTIRLLVLVSISIGSLGLLSRFYLPVALAAPASLPSSKESSSSSSEDQLEAAESLEFADESAQDPMAGYYNANNYPVSAAGAAAGYAGYNEYADQPDSAAYTDEDGDDQSEEDDEPAAAVSRQLTRPAPLRWADNNNNNNNRYNSYEEFDGGEPRGQDTNIANAKVQLSPGDLASAAGHHHHHHYSVKGWLDMGAHTGKKGAFGWHDKHPVGGKGRR